MEDIIRARNSQKHVETKRDLSLFPLYVVESYISSEKVVKASGSNSKGTCNHNIGVQP